MIMNTLTNNKKMKKCFGILTFVVDLSSNYIRQFDVISQSISLPTTEFTTLIFNSDLVHPQDIALVKGLYLKMQDHQEEIKSEIKIKISDGFYHNFKLSILRDKDMDTYFCYLMDCGEIANLEKADNHETNLLFLSEIFSKTDVEMAFRIDFNTKEAFVFSKNCVFDFENLSTMNYQLFENQMNSCLGKYEIIRSDVECFKFDDADDYFHNGVEYNYLFKSVTEEAGYLEFTLNYNRESKIMEGYFLNVTSVILNDLEKTASLNKAVAEINNANKATDDFFKKMTHDLRTPMTAILALIDFSLEENTINDIHDYLYQVKQSANNLLEMINDVLDTKKEDHLSVKYEVLDTKEFANDIIVEIEKMASEKDVKFIVDSRSPISYRYQMFDKILTKLFLMAVLSNAIKYSKPKGTVIWRIEAIKVDNRNWIRHKVIDDGIGMSPDFQEIMFERYSRENSDLGNREKGQGLGLFSFKQLIDYWGGNIYVDSTYGEGTTITFEYPIVLGSKSYLDQVVDERVVPFNLLENKKILIVEDVEINAKIIAHLLEKKGMKITWVDNGLKAIESVSANKYDCVLMDINMPVLNGLEASKIIRNFNNEVPIVALSANDFAEDIEKSLSCGINEHLSKPINKAKLYNALIRNIKFD